MRHPTVLILVSLVRTSFLPAPLLLVLVQLLVPPPV
jgi:hypothetical protein